MSNNEIIKALECCRKAPLKECKECPYYEEEWCKVFLKRDALDLINRLQADNKEYDELIEHYDDEQTDMRSEILYLQEENKVLRSELKITYHNYCNTKILWEQEK